MTGEAHLAAFTVLVGHVGDQAFVEFLSGIVADHFEGLNQCRNFNQTSDIAAGTHVEIHLWNLHAQNFVEVLLQPGALLDDIGGPLVQRDDHVDPLIEADILHSKHFGDIDDANATALHVATIQFRTGSNQLAFVHEADVGEVVRHQRVAPFDQREGALALPDATVAAQLDAVRASFGGKLDSEKEFEF